MFSPEDYFKERRALVEQTLDRVLPPATEPPRRLHEAMRYSVFAGGKRLRPILCIAAAEGVRGETRDALVPAAALELFHTFTLVHDDLPAMDDDSLRRGKPTCHVAFDEATAILAGDALLSLSFEILAAAGAGASGCGNRLAGELASAAGSRGVIGGQMEDIRAEGSEPSAETVRGIHEMKTAALFRASARMGGIAGAGTEEEIAALTSFADRIGLAFQIVDDILNETSNPAILGKAAGSDGRLGKMTYVRVFGLKASRAKAQELVTAARQELTRLSGPVEALAAVADVVTARTA